ncbi:unnamed protein product [Mytilus edulis]|uniref:DZIP3-like HEPN domain-containing protein n=1 Tax=Mytilus edulis TaxID=6550 RepID=A0A8S3S1K4_MYTED|nr:unnamed protein product [Mytilus edulis]
MDIIEYEGDWSVCINESEFIFNEEGLEYTILDIQPGREFGKVIIETSIGQKHAVILEKYEEKEFASVFNKSEERDERSNVNTEQTGDIDENKTEEGKSRITNEVNPLPRAKDTHIIGGLQGISETDDHDSDTDSLVNYLCQTYSVLRNLKNQDLSSMINDLVIFIKERSIQDKDQPDEHVNKQSDREDESGDQADKDQPDEHGNEQSDREDENKDQPDEHGNEQSDREDESADQAGNCVQTSLFNLIAPAPTRESTFSTSEGIHDPLSNNKSDDIALLLKGVTPRAVRTYFDREFPPTYLPSTLNTNYNTLWDLKLKRIINQAQWNLLIPRNGIPDSKTFDVTLMICLIRNLTSINPPINGFDSLPLPGETTPGSDLARIKYYRNKLAHHDSNTIDTAYFHTAWTDISNAVGRLGDQTMFQECQELKLKILDQSNQEIILEVKQSLEEMKELKLTTYNLRKKQSKVTENLRKLQSLHGTLKTSHSILKSSNSTLKNSVRFLRAEQVLIRKGFKNPIPPNIRAQFNKQIEDWKKKDNILLLERNPDVNLCSKQGSTPLIQASICGHTDIVRLLLERNPVPCDNTSLSTSYVYNNISISNSPSLVQPLMKHKPDPNT